MSTIKTRPFDMANYLTNAAEVTEYLRQVLEDGDPVELPSPSIEMARPRNPGRASQVKPWASQSNYWMSSIHA